MLWSRCVLLLLCMCSPASVMSSPCPTGCCCPRLGLMVLCESLGLQSLPRSVPLSTSVLSVARNQLCNVDHLFRPFSSLQELSLSHNLLARFPRGLPPSLESLLLQENLITYITSGVLQQLRNLTRLDLEYNRIRTIQPGALQRLNKLQVLILKGNKLTSLPLNLSHSLNHLDLSANCISVLDLPSLSALVNMHVLKINSNCLRSVPESAFDGLARLRSVDLTNNLWVCQCDILYLYRWLLSGRVRMATDLVCTEPVHLAHRLLLNLSLMSICPHVLKLNEETYKMDFSTTLERKLETLPMETTGRNLIENKYLGKYSKQLEETTRGFLSKDPLETHTLVEHYSLETLTYEECLSLNKTHTVSPYRLKKTTTSHPDGEQTCRDNITSQYHQINATAAAGTQSFPSTYRHTLWLPRKPLPHLQRDSAVIISLLVVLCALIGIFLMAVLLLLKKVLLHHQRVTPLHVGSGG